MPVTRFYMPDSSLAITSFSGVVDRRAVTRYLHAHVNHPLYRHDMKEIVDLGAVVDMKLGFDSMRSVVREKNRTYAAQKTLCVFAPGDLAYGVARIYQSLAEADNGVLVEIYRTEELALAHHGLAGTSLKLLKAQCVIAQDTPVVLAEMQDGA